MKSSSAIVSTSVDAVTHSSSRAFQHTARFGGTALTVTYTLNREEHGRRQLAEVGAVMDERTLAALLCLPTGDLGQVPARLTRLVDKAEAAGFAVVFQDPDGQHWAQRRLAAPVTVLEISMHARNWDGGSSVLHDWVGYAARVLHLDELATEEKTAVLSEAAFYGIGIAAGADANTVLPPDNYKPRRWTSARWRFAELVYAQYLELAEQSS